MDKQSVAPPGTELTKKPFTAALSIAAPALQGKRNIAAGSSEARKPAVTCSFTVGGQKRRSHSSDHQLSNSSQQGFAGHHGRSQAQSWLVDLRMIVDSLVPPISIALQSIFAQRGAHRWSPTQLAMMSRLAAGAQHTPLSSGHSPLEGVILRLTDTLVLQAMDNSPES